MTTTSISRPGAVIAPRSIFERILIGVDGRKLSFDACRQAARLAEPMSAVEAATVSLFPPALAAALGVDDPAYGRKHDAGSVLSAAALFLGSQAELRLLEGLTVDALLKEAERTHATLLAIGAPEHPRIEEMILGGVAGELLHQSRCSVLLARPVPDEASFPRSIVVGIDGSDQAERAHEIARNLGIRRHSEVQSVVALGGKHIRLGEIANRHPGVKAVEAGPVRALVEASSCADLLVVGSRGLHGPRALGSVSERVAHQATCSVLVTR